MRGPSGSRSVRSSPRSATACCRPPRVRCWRTGPSASPARACPSPRCRSFSPSRRPNRLATLDKLTVIDMHTGGEPVRVVTGGYPPIPKGTILGKRAWVRDNLDHLRKMLMFEPRGHYDMYGALLVEPDLPGADIAVLFMHNEGYSTMCGHAVIALGRYAVDQGLVVAREPLTTVNIECPCGMVVASVEVKDGKAGAVSFESVPAFLFTARRSISLERYGSVIFDIAYGGAF